MADQPRVELTSCRRRRGRLHLVPFVGVLLASSAPAADSIIDGKGFPANRELISQLPFEHIDPMTGNLLLTFTDLELPGNGGFDLRIQRTYNSKIYDLYTNLSPPLLGEDSWAGLGWTLHFGRVLLNAQSSPGPIIEMPDGSRHQTYPHLDGVLTSLSGHFITRELWTYERLSIGEGRLRLPGGLVYHFAAPRGQYLYVSRINDPFGNEIVVNYPPDSAFVPHDAIASVEQRLRTGEVRVVTFTYDESLPHPAFEPRPAHSLATMTYVPTGDPPRTWTYVQKVQPPYDGRTLLTGVRPPVGPSWTFAYNESGSWASGNRTPLMLNAVTTPNRGRIDYTFAPALFRYGSTVVYSPVLSFRTASGPDVEEGTFEYDFDSPDWDEPVTALVTSPCGRTRYVTNAIGSAADERAWAIGTLARRETLTLEGEVLEKDELTWERSQPISRFPESGDSFATHLPLLRQRSVTRGGRTYRTSYTYDASPFSGSRASNFNDHGRPREVLEEGESGGLTRKTTRVFFYAATADPSFDVYIVDRTASETVRAPASGGESYISTFEYETGGGYRGFLKAQTIRGIRTDFAPHLYSGQPTGNVGSQKDALGNLTTYAYANGQVREIRTPAYTITRIINPDGTTAAEIRRGFTTKFEYDGLGRLTKLTPPVGNSTLTVYDNEEGRTVRVTRGPSTVVTTLDGFGRAVASANNLDDPVKTVTEYDPCGRRRFESYPFTGVNPGGATLAYDALGRLLQRTEPADVSGTTRVLYEYGPGLQVRATDENGNETVQFWEGFGDPGDTRLARLEDAAGETTRYEYNALDSLLEVIPPTGPRRRWTYYGAGETGGKAGLLKSETHPESGTVTYTYDNAGNLKTRADARGTTTYFYDGNNRLVRVARPESHTLNLGYDASDNRTLLENLSPGGVAAKSTFTYDGASRLIQRRDELKVRPPGTRVFTTSYAWDGNDRLDSITYPSHTTTVPRKAKYTYDEAGRVLSVANPGRKIYADRFEYHPTGAVTALRAGNGTTQTFAYTRRNRLKEVDDNRSNLNLQYVYERNGNVERIDDTRTGFDQTFGHDELDRLISVGSAIPAWAGTFQYDERGNRRSSTVGGTATFSYHPLTDRLQSVDRGGIVESLTYDGYGNLASRQVGGSAPETFTYTPDHMLETATVGGALTRYRYDGEGLRVAREQDADLRYFIHGPGGQLLSEFRECPGSLEPTRDYVQAGIRLLAIVQPSPPLAALTAAAVAVSEQPGASVSLTVRLTTASGCPTNNPAVVAFETRNGTAVAGPDYAPTSGTLFFPAGTASGATQTVMVPLVNDTLVEGSETFTFLLSAQEGAVNGAVASTTVTILDNDTPVVAWSVAVTSVLESAGTAVVVARVMAPEGNALQGPVAVSYFTANAGAVSPADYTARTGRVDFAAGLPSGSEVSIPISVVNDTAVENDEMFKVVLHTPMGAVLGAPATANVTLLDVSPRLSFAEPMAEASEREGAVRIGIRLLTPDGQATRVSATVRFVTANQTALSTQDYVLAKGTLSFPVGTPSGAVQPLSVDLREDALSEDAETFKVTLSAPSGGKLGTPIAATLRILDDDPLPVAALPDAVITEPNSGKRGLAFTVRLSAPAGRAVSVGFGAAGMTALPGSDFIAVTGRLSFAAGVTSRSIVVSVRGDTVDEENEAFLVSLSDPMNLTLGRAVGQGTILDNDGRPAYCLPVAILPYLIAAPGHYCLAGDLSFPESSGAAITIASDDARLDLRGFRLDGSSAGGETQARGVQAQDRFRLVVSNGRILGFHTGVELAGTAPHVSSGQHLLDRLMVEESRNIGVLVQGRGSTIRGSAVHSTGGGSGEGTDTFGIVLGGPGGRVLDNDVANTVGIGSGIGYGVALDRADGAIALGNRFFGDGSGTGLLIRASRDTIVSRNRFLRLGAGLLFEDPSTGVYRGNLTSGVGAPYQGGTDAGGNQ